MSDAEGAPSQATFKKRTVRGRGGRKRRQSSSDENKSDESDGKTVVVPAKRAPKQNPNVQSTGAARKRSEREHDASSGSEDDVSVHYRSAGATTSVQQQRENATATYQMDTEFDRDAQAIFEKAQRVNEELEGEADDKIYRGINNYAQYYKKKDTAAGNASSGLVRKGPIRAPANLRATVRWDYQPDICKDYKETGFCGFGDSCKFLHDRSDYKHGWQLERDELDAARAGAAADSDGDYEVDSDTEHLPFKCFICRQSFTEPVVTKCKHYFCEKCALEQYKKSQRCYVCSAQTGGVFNPAKEISSRLKGRADEGSGEDSDDS